MKKSFLLPLMMLVLIALPLFAEDWLTIYNDDLSLVRSSFELDLEKGVHRYNYDDITSRIEASSVIINGNGLRIAEQNYEYDLADKFKIMSKYLDKEVLVVTKDQSKLRGTLKFYDHSSIGIIEDGTNRLLVISADEVQWTQLASLPENFFTKPTLAWNLIAPKKGKYPVTLSYLSGGFSWDVTYNAVWDEEKLSLSSWVTIQNTSGRSFENTNLKLIAGEVNRVQDYYYKGRYGGMLLEATADSYYDSAPSFEEKAFHDFHLYTLDQKVSFANNQTKQLELYEPSNVLARSVYEYQAHSSDIKSVIKFTNNTDSGLGKPLPKGKIKVYKADTDGNLEFIGENRINHTSKNEEVNIVTGTAFDLKGITTIRNQKTISNKVSEREIMITLKNNSNERKSINVIVPLNSYTKIIKSERRYAFDEVKNQVTYTVDVPADGEYSFTYTERSEW